jgi:hypothetical protein
MPADADAPYVIDQYEALRREALEVAPFGPRGQGLALLLARGVPAWLTALAAVVPPPPAPGLDDRPRAHPPRLPAAARAELTTVLAGMVLACTAEREAHR